MAPLDDLYAALQTSNEQKKAIADSNPYTPAANIFGQLGTTIATSGPQYSLRDKLIYGAITGLFGGALTGLADRRNNNAQAAYTDVIRRGLAGETNIQQPDDLPSGLFQSAIQAKDMALFKREIAQQAAEQEFNQDLQKAAATQSIAKAIENPRRAPEFLTAGQNALATLTGKRPSGVQIDATGTAPVTSASQQINPEIQKLIDERNAIADVTDDAYANRLMEERSKALQDTQKAEQTKKTDQTQMVDSLRKEINSLDEMKKFKEVSDRYSVLKQAFLDPAKISDLDYIYGVAKVLDPTSVVRESEGQMVIDAQSIPESVLGQLNTMISGGQGLSSQQRLNLLRLADRHYTTIGQKIEAANQRYSDIAKNRGLNVAELGLAPTTASALPQDPAAQTQYLAQIASRFPNTPEGRQQFKEAVQLLGR